jgi:hypothetical protein
MEDSKKKKQKKNKRPLFILGTFFVFFILFISLISMSSKSESAKEELNACSSIEEVKQVWLSHKKELYKDEDFIAAVKAKLISFNLKDRDVANCIKWLPPVPTSLNIIVVPDLSGRIIDQVNNPGQIAVDKVLIRYIWDIFRESTQFKKGTKDRMMIDVTDSGQAGGQFRTVADSLVFDLSLNNKAKINKFYFDLKAPTFYSSLDKIYNLAEKEPLGANYWTYFNRNLPDRILPPDLYNNYRNVLVLLTDGYLEAETKEETGRAYYTGTYYERQKYCNNGPYKIEAIEDCKKHFPNLEVLVLEVTPRKAGSKFEKIDIGTKCDQDILLQQWQNWFELLEIKNARDDNFKLHDNTIHITKEKIKRFLKSNGM